MSFYPTGPLPMIDLVGGVDAPHLHHPLDLGEGQVEGGAAHNVPGQKDTVTSLTHFIRPVNTTYKCTHQRKRGTLGGWEEKNWTGEGGREKEEVCAQYANYARYLCNLARALCFPKSGKGR